MSVLTKSLLVAVLGMAVVFIVLVVLTVIASLMKYVNRIPTREELKAKRKKAKEAKAAAVEETAEPETVPAVQAAETETPGDDAEITAVIAAAINAYLAETGTAGTVPPTGIIVRSVRRLPRRA